MAQILNRKSDTDLLSYQSSHQASQPPFQIDEDAYSQNAAHLLRAAALRIGSMASHSSSVSPTLGNTNQPSASAVWIIVGASRGIGLEFVRQLLLGGHRVYAVIRDPANASHLWSLAGSGSAKCELLQCDVTNEQSIQRLAQDLIARKHLERIDYVVLNASILQYPNV